jgi:predicted dienelactone hydrolase
MTRPEFTQNGKLPVRRKVDVGVRLPIATLPAGYGSDFNSFMVTSAGNAF